MKKISAILLTLLAIAPCVPQKASADALTCLVIGGGLGVLGLGIIHPKTSDYWDMFKDFGLSDGEKATPPYKIVDKYFNWRLPLTATKRPWTEKLEDKFKAAKDATDEKKFMWTAGSLAATELLCILAGLHFILKAARV